MSGAGKPSESSEEYTATFREAREYARGSLDVDHHDVHPITGLVGDESTRHTLEFMADAYDRGELIEQAVATAETEDLVDRLLETHAPASLARRVPELDGDETERMMRGVLGDLDERVEEIVTEDLRGELPASFWEGEFAQRATQKYATDRATQAIKEGNLTQTAFLTGLPSYESDVSGLQAVEQLADWLVHSEQCKLIYIAALMGRGKTDLSLLMFEVIHNHFKRVRESLSEQGLDDALGEVPEPEFAANFAASTPDSLDVEIEEIHTEEQLVEWGEQGDSSMERWFIFDEASTELTAQSGANAQKVAETMGPFVKKMRKMGINMIVIGHDKGDIHVAIRSLADVVDKQGLKTASFYAGINDREPTGHLFDLDGIPPTAWEFDTDDTADWRWAEEDEDATTGMDDDEFKKEVKERAGRIYAETPEDVTLDDVATAMSTETYSLSASTVSRAASEFKESAT